MKKVVMASALVLAGCSGKGEIIPTPSPEPHTPTTLQPINSTALAAPEAPTTTVPATTTTEPEPEPTTIPTVPPRRSTTTTTEYLREQAVIESSTEWAIPTYIVMCESGGNWYAYNASGASGPYQLMPLHFGGELAMHQSREAQHAKAAELWNGGKGKSHWAACL